MVLGGKENELPALKFALEEKNNSKNSKILIKWRRSKIGLKIHCLKSNKREQKLTPGMVLLQFFSGFGTFVFQYKSMTPEVCMETCILSDFYWQILIYRCTTVVCRIYQNNEDDFLFQYWVYQALKSMDTQNYGNKEKLLI